MDPLQILLLFLFLLHHHTLTSGAAHSPAMLPSATCSDELVTFSSCLPYIAVFPHNLTDFPPPQCCDDFSTAFGSDSAVCICYFALQQKSNEFPINSTKLLSLASVCPLKSQNSKAKITLETLRSGIRGAFRSITGGESPPTTIMGTSQESRPSEPSLSSLSAKVSSATRYINNAPLMQQSPSDYPPEMNFSETPPSQDLSTLPDLARRPKPPKNPSPPSPPSPPNPPGPPITIEPTPLPDQAQGPGPSCKCSQSTNLGPLSPFAKSLFMLLLIGV